MDRVVRLLSDLVAIPSVNPMGRSLSGPGIYEQGMSDFLENWFKERGVPYDRIAVAPGRDNVIGYYHAPGARRTLLFDVHQDTVPVDNMIIDPFKPVIEGDRLYGRGSCDIKGAMASMLIAFERLVATCPEGSASVILACTVDEEFTHLGALQVAHSRPQVDLAIVAEPTELNVVHCHKGAVRWKIRTEGTACHSSTPWLGANAIYRMASVLKTLDCYAAGLVNRTPDPILGPPTISVGRIEGGQSVNVVPDSCFIEIDRRLLPGETGLDAVNDVKSWIHDDLKELAQFVHFDNPWLDSPPLSPQSAKDWIGLVQDSIGETLGKTPSIHGVPYGTDSGPLARSGIPCLVIGPGNIAQAHTKDEWVNLSQIQSAVDVYYDLACRLG